MENPGGAWFFLSNSYPLPTFALMNQFSSGFTLGILGGGQLGKMLLNVANRMDVRTKVLDPQTDSPCRYLCDEFVLGDFRDLKTVLDFGQNCDTITVEIEQVNVGALRNLTKSGKSVLPTADVLEVIQNKIKQKEFYLKHEIPTASFSSYTGKAGLHSMLSGYPTVQKSATMGYDGRGVVILRSAEDLARVADVPGIVEEYIADAIEIAVIVARRSSGEMKCFPPVRMEFNPAANLVEFVSCPAGLDEKILEKANVIALKTANAFQVCGLLAIEMFVKSDGEVIVNESAPRPHNSGHITIEANYTSQYEQHLRAILNLPLGDTRLRSPAVMVNLLGEPGYSGSPLYKGIDEVLALQGASVHIYGKQETRPFRKMGHVTILGETIQEAREKAIFVRQRLKVIA